MGKAYHTGKDLTEVRSPHRQLAPDKVGSGQHEPTFLRAIAIKAKSHKQHRFRDLYRCLDAELLRHCWRDLNKDAASGVDGVTASEYAKELDTRIEALAERVKTKRYRAKVVRRVYIPKDNGKERPLGVPVLEDKLVQLAVSKLLTAIYEGDFLDSSYGYRPGRGALDAVKDLTFDLQYGVYGYVVEADIQGFFDHMDHDWLLKMLKERIDDRALLGLIRKWLKAGVLETDGSIVRSATGTPQGGIVTPWTQKVTSSLSAKLRCVVRTHCLTCVAGSNTFMTNVAVHPYRKGPTPERRLRPARPWLRRSAGGGGVECGFWHVAPPSLPLPARGPGDRASGGRGGPGHPDHPQGARGGGSQASRTCACQRFNHRRGRGARDLELSTRGAPGWLIAAGDALRSNSSIPLTACSVQNWRRSMSSWFQSAAVVRTRALR
jgi:retron-type reverse transcriptase